MTRFKKSAKSKYCLINFWYSEHQKLGFVSITYQDGSFSKYNFLKQDFQFSLDGKLTAAAIKMW